MLCVYRRCSKLNFQPSERLMKIEYHSNRSQDEVMIRKPEAEEEGNHDDDKAALDDIGHNADSYFSNQLLLQD